MKGSVRQTQRFNAAVNAKQAGALQELSPLSITAALLGHTNDPTPAIASSPKTCHFRVKCFWSLPPLTDAMDSM